MNKQRMTLWCFFFGAFCSIALGITPGEVFQDGRREFNLGHWGNARNFFARFLETWPDHPLGPEAIYYHTLAEIREEKGLDVQATEERIASFSNTAKFLAEKLPATDMNEFWVAVEMKKAQIDQNSASFSKTLEMSPEMLQHALNRGWFPGPSKNPATILEWIFSWLTRHEAKASPQLQARLYLLKAKALWQFRLSPLTNEGYESKLKLWNAWPIQDALEKSLEFSFKMGDLEIKRETALLGVSSDFFKFRRRKDFEKSGWIRYLKERGICFIETWCPR